MNLIFRLSLACVCLLVLVSCAAPPASALPIRTPDADAVELVALGAQASQIAQESGGLVLRQVDTDLTITDFRFVDRLLTREIMIVVPQPGSPAGEWRTVVSSVSPLLTFSAPDINLQSLKVGPSRVAQSITSHWPGCKVRGITLYRENGNLTWLAFCDTPDGVVSGSMDNETGLFQPSPGPPASIPAVATPAP